MLRKVSKIKFPLKRMGCQVVVSVLMFLSKFRTYLIFDS